MYAAGGESCGNSEKLKAIEDLTMLSPDQHAKGFLSAELDPLRYDGHPTDPDEAAAMIAGLVQTKARVLDVGCGTGAISKFLVETRGVRLIGIEPDPQRANTARGRGIDVVEGFFNEQTIADFEPFDVVIFADVLEHLSEPATALQLARRVLKPDGTVVASIPNIAHWSVRLDLLRGRFDYQPYGIMDATHLRWFTEKSVRILFEATGYEVESIQHTTGFLLPAYSEFFFWRHFRPRRYRRPLVRFLVQSMPRLFGCQHVVRAARKK
jgi:methionine biosynthesis protein MetW